jgi:hypothetical protein
VLTWLSAFCTCGTAAPMLFPESSAACKFCNAPKASPGILKELAPRHVGIDLPNLSRYRINHLKLTSRAFVVSLIKPTPTGGSS